MSRLPVRCGKEKREVCVWLCECGPIVHRSYMYVLSFFPLDKMFSYKNCQPVPARGGRGGFVEMLGGGLVEVEGRAAWEGRGGVYVLDKALSEWKRMADGVRLGATLAVCGGELVYVGGLNKNGVSTEVDVWRGGRWTSMPNMLVGCMSSCVVSINGGGLVVMGGYGCGSAKNDVQVFDGEAWHLGPPLPEASTYMSAVVHGDLVFVLGGDDMYTGGDMKWAVWSANITDLVSH